MERRRHFNEENASLGEMTVEFDISTGVVRTLGTGLWSVRQAKAFFKDWTHIIRHIHAAHKPVSAFVDMSESGVQIAEVAQIIANSTTDLYTGEDAIAMLVPSSLAKMQMRRVLPAAFHGFFLSRTAAETWLYAKTLPGGSRAAA